MNTASICAPLAPHALPRYPHIQLLGSRIVLRPAGVLAVGLLLATGLAQAQGNDARVAAMQSDAAQQERPSARPAGQRARPVQEARPSASALREALDSVEVKSVVSGKVRGVRITQADLAAAADVSSDVSAVPVFDPESARPALSAPELKTLRARPRPAAAAGTDPITPEVAATKFKSVIDSVPARATPSKPAQPGQFKPKLPPRLNVNAFGEDLHAALAANVAGYAMQMRRNGQTIYTLQWNWASYPQDQSLGWNPQRRMHIASVSKLMTSIAMTRALDEKGISYDARIAQHLPAYWARHPGVSNITFRQLMTHSSGFKIDSSDQSFGFMKGWIANGPTIAVGTRDYENFNFGLQRILIATVAGYIDPDANFGAPFNYVFWNAITNSAYMDYMNKKVFAPAGVNGPSLAKPSNPARAYGFPASGAGWNSGNLTQQSGGAAWHMSIDEVLKVMGALRRGSAIMPQPKAQGLLEGGFGLDSPAGGATSASGRLFHKNGGWGDGTRREQCVVFFLPDNMELAVFVNSPISSNNTFLRGLVMGVYESNLVEQ